MVKVDGPRQVREDDTIPEFPHTECKVAVVEDGIDGGRREVMVSICNEVEIVVERLSLVYGILP